MQARRPAAELQQRWCSDELSDRGEALDVGSGGPDREGVEGEATDGEGIGAGGANDVGADVRSGHRHLQKRGSQQPASGRQTSQDQTMMHCEAPTYPGFVMQGGRGCYL